MDCNSGIHVSNRSESICTLFSYSFSCSSYFLSFLSVHSFLCEGQEGVRVLHAFPFDICYHFLFSKRSNYDTVL